MEAPANQSFLADNGATQLDTDSTSFGVQAGYDYQFENNWVVRVDADYQDLNADASRQDVAPVPTTPAVTMGFTNSFEASKAYSLKLKLGYAFGNIMVYATAGQQWTSVDLNAGFTTNNGYSKGGALSDTFSSSIFGAGLEYRFSDQWSARVEYVRSNGDDATFSTVYLPGSAFVANGFAETVHQDMDYNAIRVGISYHF